jgi:glycerone phosphate O-acyltransferase
MLENFNDLIADLNQRGTLEWITEKKDYLVNLNQRGRTPAEIKQDVLKSDRLKHVIQSICLENKGITVDAVRQKAKQILDDMGHTFNVNSTKCFGFVLMKYMKKMYKHVYYTKDLKTKLESVYARHPVLFIPNHCSYVDFLLISVICHMSNVESPAIASGDNLSSIGIVSKLLRNGGAFFIRRAFGSDKLYWAVFDEYVQQQIANQDRPIEFFIEGLVYFFFFFILLLNAFNFGNVHRHQEPHTQTVSAQTRHVVRMRRMHPERPSR